LLSKLYRRAEALDGACLRAWGHPNDYAIRQELLSALEWDSSFHPDHARALIRELFAQVHDQSAELARRIRSTADKSDRIADVVSHGVQGLRRSLASLIHALESRRAEPRSG
jgi:hypothetical protein